ncbi:hypothetical protein C8R42DRAFT_660544 [Lentinula raphanica]|nr:hypothetical protein C8R42DRAFT_660544 [Lentinula raphanica]
MHLPAHMGVHIVRMKRRSKQIQMLNDRQKIDRKELQLGSSVTSGYRLAQSPRALPWESRGQGRVLWWRTGRLALTSHPS